MHHHISLICLGCSLEDLLANVFTFAKTSFPRVTSWHVYLSYGPCLHWRSFFAHHPPSWPDYLLPKNYKCTSASGQKRTSTRKSLGCGAELHKKMTSKGAKFKSSSITFSFHLVKRNWEWTWANRAWAWLLSAGFIKLKIREAVSIVLFYCSCLSQHEQ